MTSTRRPALQLIRFVFLFALTSLSPSIGRASISFSISEGPGSTSFQFSMNSGSDSTQIDSLDDLISGDDFEVIIDYEDGDGQIDMLAMKPLVLTNFKLSDGFTQIDLSVKQFDFLGTSFQDGDPGESFFEWLPGTAVELKRNADLGDLFDRSNKGSLISSSRLVLEPTTGTLAGFSPTELLFEGDWQIDAASQFDVLALRANGMGAIPEPASAIIWACGSLAAVVFGRRRGRKRESAARSTASGLCC